MLTKLQKKSHEISKEFHKKLRSIFKDKVVSDAEWWK